MENSWPRRSTTAGARAILIRRRRPSAHGGSRRSFQRKERPLLLRRRSLRKKLQELETLVPGAEGLRADQLFVRTADYIFHLKLQVHVLHTISKFYMP